MSKATEPPAPIRISDNTIINGKWYNRGEALPFERAEDLPENLRPLVVTDDPEAEEENAPRGSFELNAIYQITSDGRLGRRIQRQISEMEAAEAREEWIEEQVNAELPPEIAAALQEEHENAVAYTKAQMAYDAKMSDAITDGAIAAAEVPTLFVRRGSRHYAPVGSTRLKPGEPVYIRNPNGRFECIGETDSKGSPPDAPISL
jgi:hypothetical protein